MVAILSEVVSEPIESQIPKIREGDSLAICRFIQSFTPFIKRIANKFAKQNSYQHDLLRQIGEECAIEAVYNWHPEKRNLEPYVKRSIRNGIYYECRKSKRLNEHEKPFSDIADSQDNNTFLEPEFIDRGFDEIDRADFRPILHEKIHTWMHSLSLQKRKIIELVFFQSMNQSRAAEKMGLSRARVSQLINEIINQGRISLAEIAYLN